MMMIIIIIIIIIIIGNNCKCCYLPAWNDIQQHVHKNNTSIPIHFNIFINHNFSSNIIVHTDVCKAKITISYYRKMKKYIYCLISIKTDNKSVSIYNIKYKTEVQWNNVHGFLRCNASNDILTTLIIKTNSPHLSILRWIVQETDKRNACTLQNLLWWSCYTPYKYSNVMFSWINWVTKI